MKLSRTQRRRRREAAAAVERTLLPPRTRPTSVSVSSGMMLDRHLTDAIWPIQMRMLERRR